MSKASDAIDLPRLRRLRVLLHDARIDALLAAWSRSKRQRRAYAAHLRALLADIDNEVAAIERAGWDD